MIDRRWRLSLTGLYACLILRTGSSADRSTAVSVVPRPRARLILRAGGSRSFRQSGEMGGGGTVVTAGGGGGRGQWGPGPGPGPSRVFFSNPFFFGLINYIPTHCCISARGTAPLLSRASLTTSALRRRLSGHLRPRLRAAALPPTHAPAARPQHRAGALLPARPPAPDRGPTPGLSALPGRAGARACVRARERRRSLVPGEYWRKGVRVHLSTKRNSILFPLGPCPRSQVTKRIVN